MTQWLSGIDPRDVVRIEIVRFTLEGTPSCVTSAAFRLHLLDGSAITRGAAFSGLMYEVFVDQVRAANRVLGR